MLFEFKVYNKELIKANNRYVTNTDAFNKCKFYLHKEIWEGREIFVTFINEYGYSQSVMLGKWAEVLSCSLPELFLKGKYFKVFLYSDATFKTNTVKVVIDAAICDARKTKHHEAINYLIQELKTKIDNVIFEDNQLKFYSDGRLVDTVFVNGLNEADIRKQIEIYFKEFEEKVQAEIDKCITENEIDYLITNL